MTGERMNQPNAEAAPTILVYSPDLFFAIRIRTVLKQLGLQAQLASKVDEFVERASGLHDALVLAIVDFNQGVDWNAFAPVIAAGLPVVAFGAHTDVDGFRAAKAAGVARVVSNGEFNRSLPDLISRYRRAG